MPARAVTARSCRALSLRRSPTAIGARSAARRTSCRLHGTDYLDWLVETETEGRVAAVITETYQGAAGSVMAPPGWFPKLAQWCRDRDILLIIDEVQASFGRTGALFCYEHYDVVPNILCLGKGISSSVPLSAVVAESRIMDALSPGSMGSTHGGNAFCSRVALENIEVIIGERLSENAAALSGLFDRRLQQLVERLDCVARHVASVWPGGWKSSAIKPRASRRRMPRARSSRQPTGVACS